MSLKIAVIYGSVRHHRKGIRGARFIKDKCDDRGEAIKAEIKEGKPF
jgi:NAD(P)H-dependent FMN reductase